MLIRLGCLFMARVPRLALLARSDAAKDAEIYPVALLDQPRPPFVAAGLSGDSSAAQVPSSPRSGSANSPA